MSIGTKFFAGSEVPSTKTMDGKSNFGELCTDEMQEIVAKAVLETTKKNATELGIIY